MTNATAREIDADASIKQAWGRTTAKRLEQLERLGINTVRDLLLHLPRDYADRRPVSPPSQVQPGHNRTVAGFITALADVHNTGGAPRQTAVVHDTLSDLRDRRRGLPITWYGQKRLAETLRAGDEVTLSGTVMEHPYHGTRRMHQPDVQPSWQDTPPVSVGVIAPIYRLTQGLNQDAIRRFMHRALREFAPRHPTQPPRRPGPHHGEHPLGAALSPGDAPPRPGPP